jgi:hypothetical protein
MVRFPNVEVVLGSWKERLLLLGIMVSTAHVSFALSLIRRQPPFLIHSSLFCGSL